MTEPKQPAEPTPRTDPQCMAASFDKPGCASGRLQERITELERELTSALARVAEREGEIERIAMDASHDRQAMTAAIVQRDAANARAEAAEKDARSLEQRFEMYRNAWTRELKEIFPKRHEIDALVKTTKYYRENYEQWKKVVRETNDERQRQALAEWMPAAIDAMVKS